MEIKKNRYGEERVIMKIGPSKFRIMGESQFSRISEDDSGNITMFDFEGGPCLNVGGKLKFQKLSWKINEIIPEKTKQNSFCSVIVKVDG